MNYWDVAAQDFDSLYEPSHHIRFALNRWLRRGLFQRVELACEAIREMGAPTVLDVGCGSGRNIPMFLNAGASHVTGIDSSVEMLRLAAEHLKRTNSSAKTDLVTADFLRMQTPPRADLAAALGVFDYLHEDAPEFLRKMAECARGRIVFTAPGRSFVRAPLRALRYKRKGVRVHFYRRKELQDLCKNAGLSRFTVTRISSSGYFVTGWKEDAGSR